MASTLRERTCRDCGISICTLPRHRLLCDICRAAHIKSGKNRMVTSTCSLCGISRQVREKRQGSVCRTCFIEKLTRGQHSHNWRGGQIENDGYVWIFKPEHPRAVGNYVRRATLVLEEKLGRPLAPNKIAHHINEVKLDDSPDNLEEEDFGEHTANHNRKMHKAQYMGKFRWKEHNAG